VWTFYLMVEQALEGGGRRILVSSCVKIFCAEYVACRGRERGEKTALVENSSQGTPAAAPEPMMDEIHFVGWLVGDPLGRISFSPFPRAMGCQQG